MFSEDPKLEQVAGIHNGLYNVEWPGINDLGLLAKHTRMMLGVADMAGVKSAELREAIIYEAVLNAYMHGIDFGLDEEPSTPLNPIRLAEAREHLAKWNKIWSLADALQSRLFSLSFKVETVTGGYKIKCPCGIGKLVTRCDDVDLDRRLLTWNWNDFTNRHRKCL